MQNKRNNLHTNQSLSSQVSLCLMCIHKHRCIQSPERTGHLFSLIQAKYSLLQEQGERGVRDRARQTERKEERTRQVKKMLFFLFTVLSVKWDEHSHIVAKWTTLSFHLQTLCDKKKINSSQCKENWQVRYAVEIFFESVQPVRFQC